MSPVTAPERLFTITRDAYTVAEGTQACHAWLQECAGLGRPVTAWPRKLHDLAKDGTARVTALDHWDVRTGGFAEILEALLARPRSHSVSGQAAQDDLQEALPGIGLRLLTMQRPDTAQVRTLAAFITTDELYLLDPDVGLLRFPVATASQSFQAHMHQRFPAFAGGPVRVDIIKPKTTVTPWDGRTPHQPADVAGWLRVGHVALAEAHGRPESRQMILDLLSDRRHAAKVTRIFVETDTGQVGPVHHVPAALMTAFSGASVLGNPQLMQLVQQIATTIVSLPHPPEVYAFDVLPRPPHRGATHVRQRDIMLECLPHAQTRHIFATTSAGIEMRNRNMARIFCRRSDAKGSLLLGGSSHFVHEPAVRDQVRSAHELLPALCGIQQVFLFPGTVGARDAPGGGR